MAKGNFGERLKRERELREVSLEEITTATRIGLPFLEALENEDWSKLPGGVFNRGFVRTIARYLGLDEEAFLAEYDVAHSEQVPAHPEPPENRIPPPPRWIPVTLGVTLLVLLAVLVIAGIYGLKHYFGARHSQKAATDRSSTALPSEDRSSGSSTGAPDSPSSTSGVSNPATTPLDLLVSPSAPTHLRVVADGNLLLDTIIHPGENRHFSAGDEFEVTVADSGAVLLELNGQAMPPLGLPGSSGTIRLSRQDLRQASSGNAKSRTNR